MKWGMSSRNATTSGSWTGNIGNSKAAFMVTEASTKNAVGALPEINTGESTGETILRARVEELFANGFTPATISKDDAFNNSSTNYTINYWSRSTL